MSRSPGFARLYSLNTPDIFLFGAFPEGDNGHAIDGRDGKGVDTEFCGILHERWAVERPHLLGIRRSLRRALIQEPEHRVLAHSRQFFEDLLCIPGPAMVPRVGFPVVHTERLQDPPDLFQAVSDTEVRREQ